MGVPGADVRYVLESLKEIEDAIINQPVWRFIGAPCSHEECDSGYCIHPLKLLRELKAELEAIRVGP